MFFISNQVDKLEESEAARVEEKKEEEYKPVVMGKNNFLFYLIFDRVLHPRGHGNMICRMQLIN